MNTPLFLLNGMNEWCFQVPGMVFVFGVQAEWHFPTSHGKGVCDGIDGTVKCLAARVSLQRPYIDKIMTPSYQLLQWASKSVYTHVRIYLELPATAIGKNMKSNSRGIYITLLQSSATSHLICSNIRRCSYRYHTSTQCINKSLPQNCNWMYIHIIIPSHKSK